MRQHFITYLGPIWERGSEPQPGGAPAILQFNLDAKNLPCSLSPLEQQLSCPKVRFLHSMRNCLMSCCCYPCPTCCPSSEITFRNFHHTQLACSVPTHPPEKKLSAFFQSFVSFLQDRDLGKQRHLVGCYGKWAGSQPGHCGGCQWNF